MNELLLNSCKCLIYLLIKAEMPKQVEERSLHFSQSPSPKAILV